MSTMFSLNNRLILEAYKTDRALKANISSGFATVAQKTAVIGLTVLVDAHLENTVMPKGSKAYIREELLHTAPFAQKLLDSDAIEGKFIIVDLNNVEFILPPNA